MHRSPVRSKKLVRVVAEVDSAVAVGVGWVDSETAIVKAFHWADGLRRKPINTETAVLSAALRHLLHNLLKHLGRIVLGLAHHFLLNALSWRGMSLVGVRACGDPSSA